MKIIITLRHAIKQQERTYNHTMTCCGSDTCHRNLYLEVLRSEGEFLRNEHLLPNVARRRLYATYVRAAYGVLGRGNRVVVPSCVKDLIREMFPDPQGEYMGHMPSKETEDDL